MRVVSGSHGYHQRADNAQRTDRTDDCPYSRDPVEALGGPKLSGREFALGGLLIVRCDVFLGSGSGTPPIRLAPRHLLIAGRGMRLHLFPGDHTVGLALFVALDIARTLLLEERPSNPSAWRSPIISQLQRFALILRQRLVSILCGWR